MNLLFNTNKEETKINMDLRYTESNSCLLFFTILGTDEVDTKEKTVTFQSEFPDEQTALAAGFELMSIFGISYASGVIYVFNSIDSEEPDKVLDIEEQARLHFGLDNEGTRVEPVLYAGVECKESVFTLWAEKLENSKWRGCTQFDGPDNLSEWNRVVFKGGKEYNTYQEALVELAKTNVYVHGAPRIALESFVMYKDDNGEVIQITIPVKVIEDWVSTGNLYEYNPEKKSSLDNVDSVIDFNDEDERDQK